MKEGKIATVVDAVVTLFLETGKNSTVKEIALRLGWSEAAVRACIKDDQGFAAPGLLFDEETRPSRSKNYDTCERGVHKVTTYGPTREALRQIINARSA